MVINERYYSVPVSLPFTKERILIWVSPVTGQQISFAESLAYPFTCFPIQASRDAIINNHQVAVDGKKYWINLYLR